MFGRLKRAAVGAGRKLVGFVQRNSGKALTAMGAGVAFLFGNNSAQAAYTAPTGFDFSTVGLDSTNIITDTVGKLSPYMVNTMIFGASVAGIALIYKTIVRRTPRAAKS